jgi:hypothetical protein
MNGPYDFAESSSWASQFYDKYGPPLHRLMTAADLGIVDELLDEKVGAEMMSEYLYFEPPVLITGETGHPHLIAMIRYNNPLDGTRLWDNSDD